MLDCGAPIILVLRRRKSSMRMLGVEPSPRTWKARILADILHPLLATIFGRRVENPSIQSSGFSHREDPNFRTAGGFRRVDAGGFEPPTSSMPWKRATVAPSARITKNGFESFIKGAFLPTFNRLFPEGVESLFFARWCGGRSRR